MGVLLKKRFWFEGIAGKINFDITVNVNKAGEFTAYYPENAIEFLEKRFIKVCRGRANKKGYLWAKSLQQIGERVAEDFDKALDCKAVKESPIIKYKIKSTISFCVDKDNNIFPDGTFKDKIHWYKGKTQTDSCHPSFYGFNAYAQIYLKKEYKTVEGVKYKYQILHDDECEKLGKQIGILSHWRSSTHDDHTDDNLEEIPCTEKNAEFFNSLFFSICRMTMRIDELSTPKKLQELIDKGNKFLPLRS